MAAPRLTVALLALALMPSPGASAAGGVDRFEALYSESQRAFEARDHDRALELLRAAWDVRPEPTLLFNMGIVQEEAGRFGDAIASYRRYLEVARDEAGREEAEARIAAARGKALAAWDQAAIRPEAPVEPPTTSPAVAVAEAGGDDLDTWGIVGTTTGAAATVAGVTLLVLAARDRSAFESASTGPGPVRGYSRAEALAEDESIRRMSGAGIALTAVGGAALVTGVVLFALHEDDDGAVRASVSPLGGVTLGGTF